MIGVPLTRLVTMSTPAQSPGLPGLYQTGIRMPAGVTGPRAAVRMTIGGNASNSVNIDVQ